MTQNSLTMPFDGHDVRITDQNGQPWLFAKDVCACLGLENTSRAIERLDEDEKGMITTHTLGGPQETLIISESGFYELVLTSRKPEAKAFKKWVKSVLLPAFREQMGYADPRDFVENAPETFAPSRLATLEVELDEYVELLKTGVAYWREKAGSKTAKRTYRGRLTDMEKATVDNLSTDLSLTKTEIAGIVQRPVGTISARIDAVRDQIAKGA